MKKLTQKQKEEKRKRLYEKFSKRFDAEQVAAILNQELQRKLQNTE